MFTCVQKSQKTLCVQERLYQESPSTCIYENSNYLERIIGDSVIKLDEIIEATKIIPVKTIPTNFNTKKATYKIDNLYISLTIFVISHSTIDNHQYLLLPYKNISQKENMYYIS